MANSLEGSTLFVGITHVDSTGKLVRREQVFGRVESVTKRGGIRLVQSNGEPYVLAPVLGAIEVGDVDSYQLSEADELVENPDFVAWLDAIEPSLN